MNKNESIKKGIKQSIRCGKPKPKLLKLASDFKYRSRLCVHWEASNATACAMKKKGKCDFAHGPLELRVKETRRNRWGKPCQSQASGGSVITLTLNLFLTYLTFTFTSSLPLPSLPLSLGDELNDSNSISAHQSHIISMRLSGV